MLTCSPLQDLVEDRIARVALAQQPPPPPQPPAPPVKQTHENGIRAFVLDHLVGRNNEHGWFWFVVLFLFCAFLLGMNLFLVNKIDRVVQMQSNLLMLLR